MNDKTLSIIIKAQDQASKVLDNVGDGVQSLGEKALHFAKIAGIAFAGAATAATVFAVKSAASFEQTRIGLESMLGSADEARKVLAQVSKFAAQTPFEFPELAGAVKQLVAFGFGGQEAIDTMKQLGDVSAAVGTPISDLSYLMGTLRTQGRAFTIDIRQFAQRGIPIYEYLAKVLNTNTQEINNMIEAGKIGFPEVQKAFEAMTAQGGKFHGAMAKQSTSLSGLFSTLKDNIGLAAREMVGINQEGDVKKGSLFDRLRLGAAGLIEELDKIDWAKFSARAMTEIEKIVQKLRDIGDNVATIGRLIAQTFSEAGPQLQTGEDSFLGFKNVLVDVHNVLQSVVDSIVSLYGTLMNSAPVIIIGQFLQQVLWPALQAVAAAIWQNLVPALGQLWDSVVRLWNSLNPALADSLKVIAALIGGLLLAAIYILISALNIAVQVFSMVISVISNVINWISNLISWFGNLVGVVVNTVRTVIAIFSNLTPAVRDVIGLTVGIFWTLGSMIASAVGNVAGILIHPFQVAYDQIAGIVGRIKSAVSSIGSGISGAVKSIIPGFASGTSYAPGGLAWVGENGPELVNLPRGSQVHTNDESRQIAAAPSYNFYGDIHLNTAAAVDRFADRFEMGALGAGV